MRRITGYLIWAYVLTVPWDVVSLPMFGSLSRITGVLSISAALLTIVMEGRLRKPSLILNLSVLFAAASAMSLLWSIATDDTSMRAFTYIQLVASVWMVEEFARDSNDQEQLLFAYCMGTFAPLLSMLSNYVNGVEISMAGRYSAANMNADDLGLTLVIGIPMAYHLILRRKGIMRTGSVVFLALAPIAVLLTGTRGAFLAGLVALTIVPMTMPKLKARSLAMVVGLLFVAAVGTAVVVPKTTWDRIATIDDELRGGQMTGRASIWQAGLDVFPERPIFGVGAGAFGVAVEGQLFKRQVSHNVFLGIMVEQGLVGLILFLAVLAACGYAILGLEPPERKLWMSVSGAWLIGALSANYEYRKVTWLLFGLIAARYALETMRRRQVRVSPAAAEAGRMVPVGPSSPREYRDPRVIPLPTR